MKNRQRLDDPGFMYIHCLRKKPMSSKKQAAEEAARLRHITKCKIIVEYRCRICHDWHVGKHKLSVTTKVD